MTKLKQKKFPCMSISVMQLANNIGREFGITGEDICDRYLQICQKTEFDQSAVDDLVKNILHDIKGKEESFVVAFVKPIKSEKRAKRNGISKITPPKNLSISGDEELNDEQKAELNRLRRRAFAQAREHGISEVDFKRWCQNQFGILSRKELNAEQWSFINAKLQIGKVREEIVKKWTGN